VNSAPYAWHFACHLLGWEVREVTLRIEESIEERFDGKRTILRLSGRIESNHLDELKAQIRRNGPAIALDLENVTLVDVGAVRFLGLCESDGIDVLHCAPYIRQWMGRERGREA
jgi:hypothetical protein